jgi:hypothetical protein
MTLQDAVGAIAAGLALGLVLASGWIEWSPSNAASMTGDNVPHVAASRPNGEAPPQPKSLTTGCDQRDGDGHRDRMRDSALSVHPTYCPISSD